MEEKILKELKNNNKINSIEYEKVHKSVVRIYNTGLISCYKDKTHLRTLKYRGVILGFTDSKILEILRKNNYDFLNEIELT